MCLFLPEHLQVLAVAATCVYFVYRTFALKIRPQSRDLLLALCLGSGYLLYLIAVPLTAPPHRHMVQMLCERRVSFLLLPLLFAIVAQPFRALIVRQLHWFVLGCIIVAVMGNLDFLYHHIIVEGRSNALSHVHYRMIFERFTGIHPTYMSMYLCFAIVIALRPPLFGGFVSARLRFALFYFLLLCLLALFAKTPIIALALIGLHFMVANWRGLFKYKWVFVSMVGLVAGAYLFIPFFRQRFAELAGFGSSSAIGNITQNSVNTRKLIWQTDLGMLQHYWLSGTGPGRLLELLNQRYFFHSIYRGYWVGYFDPHSQYFYEWISFGIVGILLLGAALLIQFRLALLQPNKLYLYLLIVVALTFFTESLLARQQGVLFYSIFTSLLFFYSLHSRGGSVTLPAQSPQTGK
jgi:O-antigen ligase